MSRTPSWPAIVVVALACQPSIPHTPPASSINYAVYNLGKDQIPQPNGISLQPAALATLPSSAEKELLSVFAANGGFPNDQEVPVTIQFQRVNVASNGDTTIVAPSLDISSVTSTNVVAFDVSSKGTLTKLPLAPVTASDYVISGNTGTLTLHNQGDNPWPPGVTVVLAVEGGAGGVTVNGGEQVVAAPNLFLLLGNQPLNSPQNVTILPGTLAQQLQEGAQLEAIRQQYQPVFVALQALFGIPTSQIISLTTFPVAPSTSAFVETNAASGVVPIPSDLLLDPTATHVQNVPAFGALAPGIATLDGFSTTGPIVAQTSAPILAGTVTSKTVLLYDLSTPSKPVRLSDPPSANGVYETEPAQVTTTMMGTSVADAVVLQPAVPAVTSTGLVALPPLKEDTEYAVVISNGVQDLNKQGLSRSTVAQILLFQEPLTSSSGVSELPGVDNGTAQTLERMRLLLQPVVTQFESDTGQPESNISIAYTFRTQSITGKNAVAGNAATEGLLQLAALPYQSASQIVATAPNMLTVTQAFAKYGVDTTVVPNADIGAIWETTFPTINLLSNTTGAFNPSQPAPEIVNALIALPKTASVAACPGGGSFPANSLCAPLVVFHHGLFGARGQMLLVANELVKQGFVVAAIDSPKEGDRSWCSTNNNAQCAAGSTCVAIPGGAAQGDTIPPGTCSNGLLETPVLCTTTACLTAWEGTPNRDGIAAASGNYLVSQNFFRTRDTFRQDVIDNSALILALAPTTKSSSAFTTALATYGIVLNPSEVYWESQSLGSILGTLNVASNPRISRAAFNVGGGTIVDILLNSPDLASDASALLTSLGVVPGTPQYLELTLLAKWVLDPAEPVNVAANLLGTSGHPTLPDLLSMKSSQAAKQVLGQLAACDMTVPNAFNLELYDLIGLGPVATTASTLTVFENTADAGGACPFGIATTSPGTVPHTFLTSWGTVFSSTDQFVSTDMNVAALTKLAQDQNVAFLANPMTLPPPLQTQP